MPTINLKKIRPETVKYKHEDKSAEYYNSNAWYKLRNKYYYEHPLCEECLKEGRTTVGEHVHHKRPFLSGYNEAERWTLLLDESNLETVCVECHHKLHRKINS